MVHLTRAMALFMLAGCETWPRYNNLPEGDTDALPSSVDPRELFSVTWSEVDESEPNDAPEQAESVSLTSANVGVAFDATATGIGWATGLDPDVVSSDECGSSGELTAGVEEGSWLGDVDTFDITMTESGVLCGRALLSDDEAVEIGWDLLLFEVDECGVPLAAMRRESAVVGFGLGGRADGWGLELDAGSYLAVFAPYSPNDLDAVVDYTVGFVLLENHGNDEALCPFLPDEETE